MKREYIEILADATETAEALYESLQKGDKGSGGNSDFFKTSAVNLLAASIYFGLDTRMANIQIYRMYWLSLIKNMTYFLKSSFPNLN